MYRYFIQPQLNVRTNSLIGYELLIRQWNDGRWCVPANFASIPIAEQVDLIHAVAGELRLKIGSLSLNLNRTQFVNPRIADAVIELAAAILPVMLVVEVTEEPTDELITSAQMLAQVATFNNHLIDLSLDDVGSGMNTIEHLETLIPHAVELKFAMQNMRRTLTEPEIHAEVERWLKIARKNRQRLILEGIEDEADEAMANRLDIAFRQGYFYGKPHLSMLPNDEKDHPEFFVDGR